MRINIYHVAFDKSFFELCEIDAFLIHEILGRTAREQT